MLKKIEVSRLQVGMYVHALDCSLFDDSFLQSNFLVNDELLIQKINILGINQVIIDTEKGIDCDAKQEIDVKQTTADKNSDTKKEIDTKQTTSEKKSDAKEEINTKQTTSEKTNASVIDKTKEVNKTEEFNTARSIMKEATHIIRDLMYDVRVGKQVEVQRLEPVIEKIINSIFRNKDALSCMTRMKTRDEYTFMHSVSVSGLMAAFARDRGMPKDTIKQVAMGGLLHDVGKMLIPDKILNKPGKLTDAEFEIMKQHVDKGYETLSNTTGIKKVAMDVVTMHHERIDGSGYPHGLKGDEISEVGQMAAVVDAYDALTSIRCYKAAWEPADTLKKFLEWSGKNFNKEMVESFIHCLGIYPVGSLVELQSGLLAIVIDQNENDLLRPDVRIIYDSRNRRYVKVKDIQLSKQRDYHIVQAVSLTKYKIDIGTFL